MKNKLHILLIFICLVNGTKIYSQCGCDVVNCSTILPDVTLFNIHYGDLITMNAPPLPSNWQGGLPASAAYAWFRVNTKTNDDPNNNSGIIFLTSSQAANSFTMNPLQYFSNPIVSQGFGYFTCRTLSKSSSASSTTCFYGRSFKVVFSPVPPPVLISNQNISICQGQSIQLNASNQVGTIQWRTGSSTGTIVGTGNSITVSPSINTTYYVNSYNGTGNTSFEDLCLSTSLSINVTVNQIPVSPIANNSGIACEGDTLTLIASTVPNATYTWTGPNGFTSNQQNPIINNITTASAGTYSVTANNNGCSSISASTNVIINKATLSYNGPICEGNSLSLTASTIPNASYFWTGPNGFTSTLQNPTVSNLTTTTMAGTYQCYTTINSCTSPFPATVNVNIIQRPPTPIVANSGPVCVGQTINLVASSIQDATYNWSGPNGFTSSLQNPTVTNSASLSNAGTYNLTVTKNGCTSDVSSTIVEINKTTASNNGPVCSGQQLLLNATNVTGATYSWTGPNGFTSNQQNPVVNSSANSTMNGVYSVTSTVNNCTSSPSVTIVNVVNGPALPTITQNGNILTSSSVNGNQWYSQNGPIVGAVNQNYTPTVSGSYYVVVTSSGCSSSSSIINFNALSIDDNVIEDALSIYPNPTSSEINLRFNANLNITSGVISLFNIVSQEVYNHNLYFENGEANFKVSLPNGVYFLMFNSYDNQIKITKKIIIEN
jgi:hypothetical protein